MIEATIAESTSVNPAPSGYKTAIGKPEMRELEKCGAEMADRTGDEPTISGWLVSVLLTQAEWDEQARLFIEYSHCQRQDMKRAAEYHPKIIWPAWLLKADKHLMGANHIRKKGYNTMDADLTYGPGWLDEDDGGPICKYSEDYKPLGKYELPRIWGDE